MIILGITGPTGSGKTTLLQHIVDRNGCVLDLDAIYHELLQTDKGLLRELEDRFPGVIRDGALDRKALGAIVFADPEALLDLNAITGKYILAETDRRLRAAEADGVPLAAIDAIDGIPEEYARARISAQRPNEYYAERCGFTLSNDSTREAFARKCDELLDQILLGKE